MHLRRILSTILALLILTMEVSALDTNLAQNQAHWAEQSISDCITLNLLDKTPDTAWPDQPVTPALISSVFSKAFSLNITLGSPITRQEIANIIEAETSVQPKDIFQNYPDGDFKPDNSLTNAEFCTLVIRLVKILNQIAPPDETAWEIIQDIKQQYPTGTLWGFSDTVGTKYYLNGVQADNLSTDVSAINATILNTNFNGRIRLPTSIKYACGGFAAMVSDSIFGKTGSPCREIFDTAQASPGDIVYFTDADGYAVHIAIVYNLFKVNGQTYFQHAGANEYEQVRYPDDVEKPFYQIGDTIRIFTRYQED